MAYRLKPYKPFTSQFRSVAEDQLTKAIGYLEEHPKGPHEAVHDARKRFKRVRALYRLVQADAPEFRDRENARIRDIARTLSAVRDATALVETIEYLLSFTGSKEEKAALQAARNVLAKRRDRIAHEEHDLPAKMTAAVEGCREAIAALDALELSDSPHKTAIRLGKAWKKQLKKAHAAVTACDQHAGAETYHDLRKRGQAYWMHLSLLRDVWPTAMLAKQSNAKALVDLLGHEHDLSVLTELVNEQPELFGDGNALASLLAAIINRQQILRQEGLEQARTVFADPVEIESDLIALLWEKAAASGGKARKSDKDTSPEAA
jgi:CHAD domain-containing protein